MTGWRFWVVLALLFAGACALAQPATIAPLAPTLSGHWAGHFKRGSSTLAVELDFNDEAGSLSGRFTAPSLRAVGIPLVDVRQNGSAVHFVLSGDETTATFNGVISPEGLSGTYVEAEAPGAFELARAPSPPACTEVEADFHNGAVRLAGTLFLPTLSPAPASIVFLHGSGPEPRDASRFEATALCRAGFAALLYDKRGVSQSTGDWREASFDDLAGDAVAALDWLAARPEVDPGRVGIYGHSQGGAIAPLVAVRWPRIAFVIAGAGAIGPMADLERYSLRKAVEGSLRDDADRRDAFAYVDRVVEAGATGLGLEALLADAPRYSDRAWYFALPPASTYYWRFQRRIAEYDSGRYWSRVRAPVLLINGAADARVPASSAALIRAALPPGTPAETLVIPLADHSYMLHPPGASWPQLSPLYPEALLKFLRAQAEVQ